jgi:hypothetical protein
MYSDKHNPNATDLRDSIGHPIDRRDERGRTNPGLWDRAPGGPSIERPRPAGGPISSPGRIKTER